MSAERERKKERGDEGKKEKKYKKLRVKYIEKRHIQTIKVMRKNWRSRKIKINHEADRKKKLNFPQLTKTFSS